jgi:hypothetical protein
VREHVGHRARRRVAVTPATGEQACEPFIARLSEAQSITLGLLYSNGTSSFRSTMWGSCAGSLPAQRASFAPPPPPL